MLNYRLLQQLAPLNFRDECKTEALPDYLARVGPLAPFIPENVLAQWLYRHWRGFESNWSFIDLARHHFELQSWPRERLLQIGSRHMEAIERWQELLSHNSYVRRSWLGDYMLHQGSWPEPIIVLATDEQSLYPDGRAMPVPYCLLEGHHRLAYLRAMTLEGAQLQPLHQVWLCRPIRDS